MPTKTQPPSRAQAAVLETFAHCTGEWGTPPSLREVADLLELSHTTVLEHARALVDIGWLNPPSGKNVGYTLTRAASTKFAKRRDR